MTLIEAIREHAIELATKSDWESVANVLNTPRRQQRETKAYYVEVYSLLGDTDFRAVTEVLASDAVGKGGIARLNDPSSDGGLYFAHPITVGLIESLRDKLPKGAADKLLSLGFTTVMLAGKEVTPEECSASWLVNADCLMSINRTDGTLRLSMNVSRNGQQVRLASITEGQGSEADQALAKSIEDALDVWLQAGG